MPGAIQDPARLNAARSAKETVGAYPQSQFWTLDDHAHMLLIEPGAAKLAGRIADWLD